MHIYIYIYMFGRIQRILAWPLRNDDTHKSRSVNNCYSTTCWYGHEGSRHANGGHAIT